MMKRKAIIATLSFLSLGAVLFTSCDKENIETELLDDSKIGQSIVRVSYNDTLVIRKGITGQLNGSGEFSFKLDLLDGDYIKPLTMSFEEGTYPTNINIAEYFFANLGEDKRNEFGEIIGKMGDFGSSLDFTRPQYTTGYIKINRINKTARAVNGEFNIRIFPPLLNELNLRPFEVKGEFENLRYDRTEPRYFDAMIQDSEFKSDQLSSYLQDETIVVDAVNSKTKESIQIKFHKDMEPGNHGPLVIEGTYTSALGVVYKTSKELTKSSIMIRSNDSEIVSGSFTLELKNKNGVIVQIKAGDFRIAY